MMQTARVRNLHWCSDAIDRMAVNGWRALGVAVAVLVKLAHGPGT